MLRDSDSGRSNVVQYSSAKSKRVLAAELFALVGGFDASMVLKESLRRMASRSEINLVLCTDSQSLYSL